MKYAIKLCLLLPKRHWHLGDEKNLWKSQIPLRYLHFFIKERTLKRLLRTFCIIVWTIKGNICHRTRNTTFYTKGTSKAGLVWFYLCILLIILYDPTVVWGSWFIVIIILPYLGNSFYDPLVNTPCLYSPILMFWKFVIALTLCTGACRYIVNRYKRCSYLGGHNT